MGGKRGEDEQGTEPSLLEKTGRKVAGEAVLHPRDIGEERRANLCFSLPGVDASRGYVEDEVGEETALRLSPSCRENLHGGGGTTHGAGLVSLALPSCAWWTRESGMGTSSSVPLIPLTEW